MASKPKPDFTNSVSGKAADAVFGAPAAPPEPPGQPNVIAKPLSIFQIAPDPKQPRRQIPSVIRQQWNGDPQKMIELFAAWTEGFAVEAGRAGDEMEELIGSLLDGEEISAEQVYQGVLPDPYRKWGVIGGSLMAVVNLAAEIRRDGLTNPITVVRDEGRFLIETGERRWLAFHLLHIFYSTNTAWTRIPAREMPASSVWRQAGENTARAQLNAISMARQLAILLMDLLADTEDFLSFNEVVEGFPCDRAYYAQVSDGNRYRIPRGKGEQLVGAMGKSGEPDVLRKYRSLLRLPDEVWMLADDLNWEEGYIRTRILEFSPVESLQIAKARQLADEVGYRVTGFGHTVTGGTVSDEAEGEQEPAPPPDPIDYDAWNGGVNDAALSSLVENAPAPSADVEADEPTIDPSLEYWQEQVLIFAYERAEAGKPWFAAMDSPSQPERLNLLIEKRLLRGSSAYTNTDYAAAHYSIAGAGCLAIGRPFLPTPQSNQCKPVSGGEFHAGNGEAPAGSQPKDDPVAQERKRQRAERTAIDLVMTFPELIKASMQQLYLKDIQTRGGRAQALRALDASDELLKSIREQIDLE